MNQPNCYTCRHRGTIPGNAHSKCMHPKVLFMQQPSTSLMAVVMGMMGGPPGQEDQLLYLNAEGCNPLNIEGNPHGIKNGWFWWPWNYDPHWLKRCDGYEATS